MLTGIHCKGSCTLNNIWWTEVCEDAATFLQSSGTSYVNGGGARNAEDKVLQHNGGGTVAVKNFLVGEHQQRIHTKLKLTGLLPVRPLMSAKSTAAAATAMSNT